MQTDVSIVIPTFNSGSALEKLVAQIEKDFSGLAYELVIVDDCSQDETWQTIEKIKASRPALKAARLSRNFGQHNATLCGMNLCHSNHIITMDDDMEVMPGEMLKVYEHALKDNVDLAYASYKKKYNSGARTILTNYFYFWSNLTNRKNERGSAYRVFTQRIVHEMRDKESEVFFLDEVTTWYTSKIKYYPVAANPSPLLKTRYNIGKLFNTSLGLILLSYLFPIRSVSILGGLMALTNFLIGIYFLLKKFLFKIPVPGYTSLIVSILFSTGIILLFIGVLAEYINKILRVSNKAPAYFVDKTL